MKKVNRIVFVFCALSLLTACQGPLEAPPVSESVASALPSAPIQTITPVPVATGVASPGPILASPSPILVTPSSPPTPLPLASMASPLPTASTEGVAFETAKAILDQRCKSCHSRTPTQPGFFQPAGGFFYDTPEQIKTQLDRILARAITSKNMPPDNITQMTDTERETLARWIEAGAPL